jgi:hypothetical protein
MRKLTSLRFKALVFGIGCIQGCTSLILTSSDLPPWDRAALWTLLAPVGAIVFFGGFFLGLWTIFWKKRPLGLVLVVSSIILNPYLIYRLRSPSAHGDGRKGVLGEITEKNWKEHEAILGVRRVYDQISKDKDSGALIKREHVRRCASAAPDDVRIEETITTYRGEGGLVRLYVVEQVDTHGDSTFRKRKIERYYDSNGTLRDAYIEFWHGRMQFGGLDTTQVAFFDEAGAPVWSWLDGGQPRKFGKNLIEPWMLSLGSAVEVQQMLGSQTIDCIAIGPPIVDPRY